VRFGATFQKDCGGLDGRECGQGDLPHMRTRSISRRYARALFELIQEGSEIQPSLGHAAQVVSMDDVVELLAAPRVTSEAKARVIEKAAGKLSGEVEQLIKMLCVRNKAELLPEINEIVNEMVRQAASKVEVDVISAAKLDAALKQKVAVVLGKAVGRKVKINVHVDSAILGGLVVRIGDRQMDYSLRTRLEGMRKALVS